MTTISRLKDLEQDFIDTHFLRDMPLGHLAGVDEHGIRAMLKQRRFVTYEFTPMCEYFDVSLGDEASRQVVCGIIGEEFGLRPGTPWPLLLQSHRRAYLEELEEIGVDRDEALNEVPSRTTMRALTQLMAYIFELGRAPELEQLVFLRFSGEVLTATEYRLHFERLERLKLLTQEKSKFLFPHLDYDVLALDGGTSHADRYLPFIEARLVSPKDWQDVRRVMKKAVELRRDFYGQFT